MLAISAAKDYHTYTLFPLVGGGHLGGDDRPVHAPKRRFRQTHKIAHMTGVEGSSTFLQDPAYLQDHDQQQQQQQQQPPPRDVQLPIKPVLAEPAES